MNSDDFQSRVGALFAEGKDLAPAELSEFLAQRCSYDEKAIRDEVESLVGAYRAAPKHEIVNRLLPNDAVLRSLERPEEALSTEPYLVARPGDQIGPYKLMERIGEGGMGAVYAAEQSQPLKRRVAVKVIKPGLDTREMTARFEAERQALAMMDHPNIAKVLDAGTTESGIPYFVMELVKGIPITQYCDQQQLTLRQRLKLFVQTCHAVEHAHQKGVIHRDLKPSNVLVAQYDREAVPKVIDFGVAKALHQKLTDKTMYTQIGQLVGTLEYMSPEQAGISLVDVDTRSDIYSLGVLLYELLTGSTPFDRERLRSVPLDEVIRIIREEEPPKPSTRLSSSDTPLQVARDYRTDFKKLRESIRGDLDWIVVKALAKLPDDRYQSVHDFYADIEHHLADQPIAARRPSTATQMRKFVRRHRLAVVLTATVLAAVTTSAIFGTLALFRQLEVTQAELDRQQADEQRRLAEQREQQEHVATKVSQLSAAARNLQSSHPVQSVLLAREALELSRQNGDILRPVAHESLLNSVSTLSGRPLPMDGSKIVDIAAASRWLVSRHENPSVVKLWKLDFEDVAPSAIELLTGNDEVSSITVSENGRWLVTGGKQVRLWDLQSPRPERSAKLLAKSEANDPLVAASAGGQWLVAEMQGGRIGMWNLNSAMLSFREIGDSPPGVRKLAIGPAGRWFAMHLDATVLLWDLERDADMANPYTVNLVEEPEQLLLISPNGKWLLMGPTDQLQLWDLTADDPAASRLTLPAGGMILHHAAFAVDGEWCFAASMWDSEVLCWDLSAAQDRIDDPLVLKGHTDGAGGLATSQDGKWLVSWGAVTGDIRFWNLAGEAPHQTPKIFWAHDAPLSVALDKNSQWFAVTARDGSTRIWDLRGSDSSLSPFILGGPNTGIRTPTAVSSDGRWIAMADDGRLELWDTAEPRHSLNYRRTLQGSEVWIASVVFTPDDRQVIVTSYDNASYVWDLRGGAPSQTASRLGKPMEDVWSFTHAVVSGHWLATGGSAGEIQIWDLNAENISATRSVLRGHDKPVFYIAGCPDGRWLVSAAADGIFLWNLGQKEAEPIVLAKEAHQPNTKMAISADSQWLVACHTEGDLKIWNLTAPDIGQSLRSLPWADPYPHIFQLALSPDARWVFTGRYNRTAQLWDLTKDPPTYRELLGHYGVQHADISSDSRWLVTGNRLGDAQLWDLHDSDPAASLRVLRGHEATIWQADISADSRWLITYGGDGTIRRWNLDEHWLLDYAKQAAGRDLSEEELTYYGIER